jgi:hypothetical protein
MIAAIAPLLQRITELLTQLLSAPRPAPVLLEQRYSAAGHSMHAPMAVLVKLLVVVKAALHPIPPEAGQPLQDRARGPPRPRAVGAHQYVPRRPYGAGRG